MKPQYQLLKLVIDLEKLSKEGEKENIIQKIFSWSFLLSPFIFGFLSLVTMGVQNGVEPLSFYQKLPYILTWVIGSAIGMAPFATTTMMESWGERKLQQIYPYFSLPNWISSLKKEPLYYNKKILYYEDYEDRRSVNNALRDLAQNFLFVCDNNPSDLKKIREAKEKFWEAHNLAWALGFAVRPKVRDYAKKEVE